jgi:hypothetical protein
MLWDVEEGGEDWKEAAALTKYLTAILWADEYRSFPSLASAYRDDSRSECPDMSV